jgi:hypothetical protein
MTSLLLRKFPFSFPGLYTLYKWGKRYLLPLASQPAGRQERLGRTFRRFQTVNLLLRILFLWKAFKTKIEPDENFRLKLNTRMRILCEGNFKGLCPSTTPFAKRGFCRIFEPVEKLIFSGWSKMPRCKPCEIPFAGAPEIPCRERPRWAFFSSLY